MATTEKGIYYPDDYNSVADIPQDFKEMAESIDDAIEKNKFDDKKIVNKLNEIDRSIENLEKQDDKTIQDMEKINEKLTNTIKQFPTRTRKRRNNNNNRQ